MDEAPTRSRVGPHARVREGTAGKKEGGSPVRGTQESARTTALAPAETEVRAGAVLPGGGGPEHQAACAVPQSTDDTYYGSCRLAEVRRKNSTAAMIAAQSTFRSRTFSTPTPHITHNPGIEPSLGGLSAIRKLGWVSIDIVFSNGRTH